MSDLADPDSASERIDDDGAEGTTEETAEASPLWTSEAALSLDEAAPIARPRGATVVMLLGEVGVGKTTLLAELWTELLLKGTSGELSFAGSVTSLAFEERSFDSRLESDSGDGGADTRRTQEDEDGFLHLRVRRPDGRPVEMLLADVTGEHFTRVREGSRLDEELPWTNRVDRFLVLLDGKDIAAVGSREIAYNYTQRLLYALQASDFVAPTSRIAIVLTKEDAINPTQRGSFEAMEGALLALAREIDPAATLLKVAARPHDRADPWGLDLVLTWLVDDDRVVSRSLGEVDPPARAMARFKV